MERCPRCKFAHLTRSRTRSLIERVRKALTAERPHRCVQCGWRGWGPERNPHDTGTMESSEVPDLAVVDSLLEEKAHH
jgi:hypothetical protein